MFWKINEPYYDSSISADKSVSEKTVAIINQSLSVDFHELDVQIKSMMTIGQTMRKDGEQKKQPVHSLWKRSIIQTNKGPYWSKSLGRNFPPLQLLWEEFQVSICNENAQISSPYKQCLNISFQVQKQSEGAIIKPTQGQTKQVLRHNKLV